MKKLFIILFISSLFIVSCNEENYLDKKPHTPTDFGFYTSEDGAIQGINAAYDILQQGERTERVEFAGTVCSGDAKVGGEPGGNDQAALQNLAKFIPLSTNNYFQIYWQYMYLGIYRCNLILYYLADPVEGFDEGLRTRLLGEAYFLRALFHFKLQINYGGYPQLQSTFANELKGVPFIDHILLQDEWNQERPELSYTWEKIEEDFINASNMLPDSYGSADVGRATNGAAKAMLAKTYLYQEKWDQAYSTAKEVINSGKYTLMGENGEKFAITRLGKNGDFEAQVSGYKYIWQPEANNCSESIFDVQHQMGYGANFNTQEGNIIPRYYGPRAVKAMTLNASTGEYEEATVEYFWGFILPTKYFVETAYKNVGCEVDGKIIDPRFKLSVVTAEDKVPFYYNDETARAQFPDSVHVDVYYNAPATGYVTWKYFTDPYYNEKRNSLGDMPQNTKYMRFADLLLIGAEAAVHSGNNSDALTWINRVRTRARNSGNTGYPQNLSAVTLEDIYAERRVELAFEGHQFYDIVRTGRAQKILKDDAMKYDVSENEEQFGANFVIGKNEIWGIPQAEIDNTNGSLSQNPGY